MGLMEGPTYKKAMSFLYYFPLWHLNEFLIGNLAGIFFVKKLQNREINDPPR